MTDLTAEHRLATYGTLAPGQVNAGQLSGLNGLWSYGTVRGHLYSQGWGAVHGCPGIVLDPLGEEIDVSIFQSADLPGHWQRLDEFEGAEYRRVETRAKTNNGMLEVFIYELVLQDI